MVNSNTVPLKNKIIIATCWKWVCLPLCSGPTWRCGRSQWPQQKPPEPARPCGSTERRPAEGPGERVSAPTRTLNTTSSLYISRCNMRERSVKDQFKTDAKKLEGTCRSLRPDSQKQMFPGGSVQRKEHKVARILHNYKITLRAQTITQAKV